MVSRLSSRLQRSSRIINPNASYHPYARVANAGTRTPSPSPTKNTIINTIPLDRRPPALRRATSISTTSSKGSLVTNMAPPSPTPLLRRSLRTASKSQQPIKLTRSSTQPHPHTHTEVTTTTVTFSEMMALDPPAKLKLKRAPSYAASSSTGARPQSPSSDEEEKARSVNAKRPRTRIRTQSNGSTASGTTCVEKEKVPIVNTSPEKEVEKVQDPVKEKEPKLTVKKSKRAKTPEISSATATLPAEPAIPATPVKVREPLISSPITSPRLRPRPRPSTLVPAPSPFRVSATSDNHSTTATTGQMLEAVAAAAAIGLTPADGTRSKSRSRSISPTQPAHPIMPASPPRTLRRTAKTVFPKMLGKTLFGVGSETGADAGGDTRTGITFASRPATAPGEPSCLGEAFVLATTTPAIANEKVRKERER